MKYIYQLFSLFVILSFSAQSVLTCGPFTIDPLFSFTRHADFPLQEFTQRKTGVVPATYGRMSLYLFYRQLVNSPLSQAENQQYLQALSERIGTHLADSAAVKPAPQPPPKEAVERWKAVRARVFAGDPKLEKEKSLPAEYFYFTNCLDDALVTAADTLEDRIKKYGITDEVKEWLSGQDAVFANCSENGKIPERLAESSADWLKKDRAYQIAAALMYAGRDAAARTEFSQISADKNSVWKNTARFVVARTYIREASFIDDTQADYAAAKTADASGNSANSQIIKSAEQKKQEKQELNKKAESQLKEILADSSMKEFHASARRLLNLIAFRANPREQRRILADKLAQSRENPNFYNDLVDYIWLMDRVENDTRETGLAREQKEAEKAGKEFAYNYNLKRRDIPSAELGADLTDWLFTYQSEDGYAHAAAKWKEAGKVHWLVAALSKAKPDSAKLAEILGEAEQIKADSPAFATVRYHQIRLLLETGNTAEAKQKLTKIAPNLKNYPLSTRNDFASLQMQLAENLDDFLQFAQRRPVVFVYSDDANEVGLELKDEKNLQVWENRVMFDDDSVQVFNQKMPLSLLRQAALKPNLPDYLKKFLIIAVWTRAFVLGNSAIQTEFTPLMAQFAPEYKVLPVTNETNSLLAIGRNPAIQIYVPTGYGREDSKPTEIDSIRGNWWCVEKHGKSDFPLFFTPEQKFQAEAEQRKIAAAGESATYLARRAVEFANQNLNNPQTPEILHWAVRSTRFGCRDSQTLKYSKMAFDILHKRFPRNDWTKKTPYYFGESSE